MEEEGEEETPENEEFTFQTVGEQLKAERERLGWSLDDVAGKTRIPIRHLESIEKSQFQKMPGNTYALGFARSYAKAMEMDEAKLGDELRIEMNDAGHGGYQAPTQDYEPADPSSVLSRMLAWTAAAIGILAIAGYFIWRSSILDGGVIEEEPETEQIAAETDAEAVQAPSAQTLDPSGQVVITATDTVWLKIYDADNKRLHEAEMKPGETYNVPQDANNPMIVTGRPDMLKITVGGKQVPPLGTGERTIADVGVSAKALTERATSAATP